MDLKKVRQLQRALVNEARKLKGKAYKWRARSEDAPGAFRCSTLTQYLYRQVVGILIPAVSIHQAFCGEELHQPWDFEAGDLLFFKGHRSHPRWEGLPSPYSFIRHVAMYLGDEKIIEARAKKGRVVIVKLGPCRKSKLLTARRLLTNPINLL